MDGVVLQHAGGGVGAGDGLVGVVLVDGGGVADAGQDALAPAREPGEEVRLDEALGDQQVAVQRQLVDPQLGAGGQAADILEVVVLKGFVDGDLLVVDDLVAEHPALLLLGGGAVQPGGDQDGDVGVGAAGADLLQQNGQGELAGHRAGVVAGDDHHRMLALGQLPQAGGADGVGEGVADQFGLGLACIVAVGAGGEDGLEVLLIHMQRERRCVVGDRKCLHGNSFLSAVLRRVFCRAPGLRSGGPGRPDCIVYT